MFGPLDQSVHQFSKASVVVKDSSQPSLPSSWRIIWKSAPIVKHYDLIRALYIDSTQLNNAAYKKESSTMVTLAKIFSKKFPNGTCLVGADFMDAFASACRHCVNNLLQCNMLPEKLEFKFQSNNSISQCCYSQVGTLAGRPTGGPCFNTLIDTLFKGSNISSSRVAAYADDSQIFCKLDKNSILDVLNVFLSAKQFGLRVHTLGKKAPTVLVNKSHLNVTIPDPFLLVDSVKFLGIFISISDSGDLVGELPAKTCRNLFFLVHQLNLALSLAISGANNQEYKNLLKISSNSVNCLIESKIQYQIPFVNANTIYKFYIIHRFAICSLLQFKTSFFNFKNKKTCQQNLTKLQSLI